MKNGTKAILAALGGLGLIGVAIGSLAKSKAKTNEDASEDEVYYCEECDDVDCVESDN